jgi:hypothetical protein
VKGTKSEYVASELKIPPRKLDWIFECTAQAQFLAELLPGEPKVTGRGMHERGSSDRHQTPRRRDGRDYSRHEGVYSKQTGFGDMD